MKIKQISICAIMAICIMVLAGCGNDDRRAMSYFEEENYQEVVALLEGNEDKSEEIEEIYLISRAHLAFENEDYREVIDLLADVENEQVEEIRQISHYQVAVEDISQRISENDADGMHEYYLIALDILDSEHQEALNAALLEEISPRLTELEIENFFAIETFSDLLSADSNETSEALAAYIDDLLEESEEYKLRAFLNRTWVRQDGGHADGLAIAVNFRDANNFATVVEPVGYFQIDDIKWREIQFVDANTFRFEDLARSDIISSYAEAIGRVNFDEFTIEVSVTAANAIGTSQILVPFED